MPGDSIKLLPWIVMVIIIVVVPATVLILAPKWESTSYYRVVNYLEKTRNTWLKNPQPAFYVYFRITVFSLLVSVVGLASGRRIIRLASIILIGGLTLALLVFKRASLCTAPFSELSSLFCLILYTAIAVLAAAIILNEVIR